MRRYVVFGPLVSLLLGLLMAACVPQPLEVVARNVPAIATPNTIRGVWSGVYACAQGPTYARLVLADAGSSQSSQGTFEFSPAPGSRAPAAGKFRVRWEHDLANGGIHVVPIGWIQAPPGYRMIDLYGRLYSDGSLAGVIPAPSCSRFAWEMDTSPGAKDALAALDNTTNRTVIAPSTPRASPIGNADAAAARRIDQWIAQDARGWIANRYDPGSVRDAVVLESAPGEPRVIRANYTFNGGQTGWVEASMSGASIQCMRFWDSQGVCRGLRSPIQANVANGPASGSTSSASIARDLKAKCPSEWKRESAIAEGNISEKIKENHRYLALSDRTTDTEKKEEDRLWKNLVDIETVDYIKNNNTLPRFFSCDR